MDSFKIQTLKNIFDSIHCEEIIKELLDFKDDWHDPLQKMFGYAIGNGICVHPWTSTLLRVKKIVEEHTKQEYNCAQLHFYPDRNDAFYSDRYDTHEDYNKQGWILIL